jgi:5S rRNA maturation endonuclease (ribonuclease M5)
MTFPQHILNWLHGRGLSDNAIATLRWNGKRIGIPVAKDDGTVFFKWRKDPASTDDTPKYVADFGGSRSLYGKVEGETVIVCEGELDALLLIDRGLSAVSSTTGASNWDARWDSRFKNKQVVVWYDDDEAGRMGADKVATRLSRQSLRVFIAKPKEPIGKDVTEQLAHSKIHDPMEHLRSGLYRFELPKPYVPPKPFVYTISEPCQDNVLELCERHGLQMKKNGREYSCRCPFHDDKNPSFTCNPEKNVWYCHSCGDGGGARKLKEMLK